MAEVNIADKELLIQHPTLEETFSNLEESMCGGSVFSPDGEGPYILDDLAKMNFPEWIYRRTSPEEYSDDALNAVRRRQSKIVQYIIPIASFSVPAGYNFELFFGDYKDQKGPERIEFGFVRGIDEKRVEDVRILKRLFKSIELREEFRGHFRLEEVSGYPGRRYLVPVRKVA